MKFIHLADCHLDGYREEKLNKLSLDNFEYVMNFSVSESVDFILLAGDLFNTALPKIETLKEVVNILKNVKDKGIMIYFIPGSHDYSPNGKTMLDVLENAGLIKNVFVGKIGSDESLYLDWTIDEKTKAHITGIHGLKGMLDKNYYSKLDYSNLISNEFKIFIFHTAIKEMLPKDLEMIESCSVDILPPGFDYYAGGHVHVRKRGAGSGEQMLDSDTLGAEDSGWKNKVIFPGPTFPNNFAELEKLKYGSFVFFNDGKLTFEKIPSKEVEVLNIDCELRNPNEVQEFIETKIEEIDVKDKIVLMRFSGVLKSGKVSDIDFKLMNKICLDKGAYIVLQNTNKLKSKEFVEVEVSEESSDEIEDKTIFENLNQINLPSDIDEKELILKLMNILDTEQFDGESKTNFTERLIEETKKLIK
ncbi:MAG: exonuclease SbcCD subunit D [Candidatus Woesearchaeota archaeon]